MLYLFGALMSVGKIKLSWRSFGKNWQSWDWKSWNLHQQWQYFLYFDRSQSPIGWKVRGFLCSPLSIYSELFFAESGRLWRRAEESARLVDQRFGTKGCALLHGELGCGSSHRESWKFGTERWSGSFWKTWDFLGKFSEESYFKTAYHKHLIKMSFYRHITIRNAKTFDKIGQMLKTNKGDTQWHFR